MALPYYDTVASDACLLLYATEHRIKIIMHQLRHYHTYRAGGKETSVAEVARHNVGREVMLTRKTLYLLATLWRDTARILQRTRHCGY